MNALLAIAIGAMMVFFGFTERGYWAFGGEAIIELVCAVYLIVWAVDKVRMKVRGGKRV